MNDGARPFLSYSRADVELVKKFQRFLLAAGVEAFRDEDGIVPGEDWQRGINAALESAARVFVFWTAAAAKSDAVRSEYEAALARPACLVIPVLLDDTPLPGPLKKRQWIDLQDLRQAPPPPNPGADYRDQARVVQFREKVEEIAGEGHLRRVESRLIQARDQLRIFNGVANCDRTKWFGGSNVLHHYAYVAIFEQLLIDLWRLTDADDANSVVGMLSRRDLPDVVAKVVYDPHTVHLRRWVEFTILSERSEELKREPTVVPNVAPERIAFNVATEVLRVLSDVYREHVNPGLGLDAIRAYQDPFATSIRQSGIPGVDFVPAEIFVPSRK